jgi:hypothetical protein
VSVGIWCGSIRGRRRVVEVGGLLFVSVCLVGLVLRTYPERRQRARVRHIGFESCHGDPRLGGGGAVLYVRSRGCGGAHEMRTWRDVIESIRIVRTRTVMHMYCGVSSRN